MTMSLNKAIAHGKEKRKPYSGNKAVARSCRNHGGCGFCEGNRLYQTNKMFERMKQEEKQNEKQGT